MGFDFDHLYEWRYRDELGGKMNAYHPLMPEGPFGDEVQIGGLPLKVYRDLGEGEVPGVAHAVLQEDAARTRRAP